MTAITKPIFEEIDADIEARAIAEAEAEIDAGRACRMPRCGSGC